MPVLPEMDDGWAQEKAMCSLLQQTRGIRREPLPEQGRSEGPGSKPAFKEVNCLRVQILSKPKMPFWGIIH